MGAASPHLRKWDGEVALPNDTAVSGVDLQVQSMLRQLLTETAVAMGKEVAVTLWDVEKFFDTIDPDRVIESAEHLNFPHVVLGLAMVMHRAPRIVLCEGCAAEPIGATARSILAGCVTSTSLARGMLRGPVAAASTSADHHIFQHVDDLTQLTIADHVRSLVIAASKHGEALGKAINGLRLRISKKTEVIASDPEAAKLVARNLHREGIHVSTAEHSDDVGITTSAGKRRAAAAQNVRLDKADVRSNRIRQLVAADRQAKKLHKTGTAPQACYGATVSPGTGGRLRELAPTQGRGLVPPLSCTGCSGLRPTRKSFSAKSRSSTG